VSDVKPICHLHFTAPNRPMSINEANKMHWAPRRLRLHPWKECTRAAYRSADKAETGVPVRILVWLPFERKARRDPHNYTSTMVKAIVDVLVAEGLVPDDTAEWVEVLDPQLVIDPELRVHIEVWPR
jgi:hypothetical protein